VLSLYRERYKVEKKFDDLKNELEAMPLRVQKIEKLQGLLFIFFVSLVMRAILLRKAREAELVDFFQHLRNCVGILPHRFHIILEWFFLNLCYSLLNSTILLLNAIPR
jgi:hypothetical protein